MSKILLWINGLAFAGLGVACLVSPEFPIGLSGLSFASGDAPVEIRAQYGGIFLAIGAFGLYGLKEQSMLLPAVLLMLLVYVGLGTGRLLGVLIDPGPLGSYTYGALGFEIGFSLLFAWAFRQELVAPQ